MGRVHLGWIALDIDGTLTNKDHHIPKEVIRYLSQLYTQGWDVMFITGRFFPSAKKALSDVFFPFFLAVQNGADIFHMPEKSLIASEHLSKEIIHKVELCYSHLPEDFIVYGGPEVEDAFYYRDTKFSAPMLDYIDQLGKAAGIEATKVDDFSKIPVEKVACIKCFGTLEDMHKMASELGKENRLAQTVLSDPFYAGGLNLITHPLATKGSVIDVLQKHTGLYGSVIGAGNDLNDLTLLQRADFSIAMEGSPKILLDVADFIAPHPDTHGVIVGIETGIARIKGS